MAVQTTDGITTPGQGDTYDYAAQLAFMAESIQLALEKRANTRIGTASERDAYKSLAGEGVIWVDTTGEKGVWVKQGNDWKPIWPEERTGWDTSFLRAQSGWKTTPSSSAANRIRGVGNWVNINYGFERTGGAISVPSTGNIPNQTVAILNSEWHPSFWQPLGNGETGRLSGMSVGSNGHIRLNSVAGSANIAKGYKFSIRGWYQRKF